jgi:hypothetical protein
LGGAHEGYTVGNLDAFEPGTSGDKRGYRKRIEKNNVMRWLVNTQGRCLCLCSSVHPNTPLTLTVK